MSFDLDDVFDAPHVGILGATTSGKTTLAAHLFQHTPAGKAIFVHQDPNDRVGGHRVDYERGGRWDVSLLKTHDRIDLVMPPSEEAAREELARIQADLFALGRSIPHDHPRFYVFVDEAHEYADLNADDDNPLVRMCKRGRRHNVRAYVISQSPADVSKKALKQCTYHVIFAVGTFSKTYFQTYHIPFDEVKTMLGTPDDHRFAVWDDFELHGPYKLDPNAVPNL